jgi:hypothetical protein
MAETVQKHGSNQYSAVELRTKEIYIEQHKTFTKDESIFNRFLEVALDPATYDLPINWFNGKTILESGCGNTGYIQVAMYRLGAKKVAYPAVPGSSICSGCTGPMG